MVVFDTTFLIPLLDPKAPEPLPDTRLKVRNLLSELEKAKEFKDLTLPPPTAQIDMNEMWKRGEDEV